MATPLDNLTNLILKVTVKLDGAPMGDTYGLSSVNITHSLNRISIAEVVLLGNIVPAKGTVPISDAADFNPGKEIEIMVGYGTTESSVFKGYIVKHMLEVDSSSPFRVKLICKHKAVGMTFNEKEASFKDKTDSDIMKEVIGDYGLTCKVTATTTKYESFYQVRSTDWDFILSRADFNGFVVSMDGDDYGLNIDKPNLSAAAVMKIAVSESMMAFEAELNAAGQPPSLKASGWDTKTQALVQSSAAEPSVNAQGDSTLTPKALSGKLSQKAMDLVTPTPMTTAELQVWANAVLLRKRLTAFKGKVKFVGTAKVKTGTIIELEGVGKKFNGKAYITSVNHSIESGLWVTTARFGLDDTPVYRLPDFGYAPATGQLPPVHGLQVATVKKLSGDPKGLGRIQITLASSSATAKPEIWARFANFYATSDAGSGFMPEVGDEVVVGFLDNDPRYPVILGSVYSDKNKTPNAAADENNYIKSLVTKAKLKLTFDDEKKAVKIETPGGNSVTISDDAKSIEIKDQNSNTVKLTSSGIDISSGKDINLKATGNLTLSATGKVSIEAKQDVAVAGMNVKNTAQVGFSAKGNATAELSASGQTTVKGAMVMIN